MKNVEKVQYCFKKIEIFVKIRYTWGDQSHWFYGHRLRNDRR